MKLIIGLGNPGKQYENTRHNVGFMVLDKLSEKWNFPKYQFDKKFNADISKKSFPLPLLPLGEGAQRADEGKKDEILLAKPQTFMNLSGEAAKKIVEFYKIPTENIVVIHDDLDIDLGEYKISIDASAGGHNGVQDIFDKLGTQKIKRIRIGIEGTGKRAGRGEIPGDVFVLQNFSNEEIEELPLAEDQLREIGIAGGIAADLKL